MLAAVLPINLEAEKEAFFQSLQTGGSIYAPQFCYADDSKAAEVRSKFDKYLQSCEESRPELLALAERILASVKNDYGNSSEYMSQVYGDLIDLDVASETATKYIKKHGLVGLLETRWLETALECSIKGNALLLVKRERYHRKKRFMSILDHEIGTHFLRNYNHKLVSHKAIPKPRRGWLLASEEGLAAINTHRCYPDKRLWRPALMYFAAHLAARHSWPELWSRLSEYVDDPELCWTVCVKVKRGVKDTGRRASDDPLLELSGCNEQPEDPSGFFKDICYFLGAMDMLRARHELDWRKLHACKCSIEELPDMLSHIDPNKKSVILPWFLKTEADLHAYEADIDIVAKSNGVA